MPLLGCPKFGATFCMRFGCIGLAWSLYLDDDAPCDPDDGFACCGWFALDWLGDCCCGCAGGSSDDDGSYLRGRPRDKWRRFTNSLSSTIQNEPKSSSYLTKHLCSDKLVRMAFYQLGFVACYLGQTIVWSRLLHVLMIRFKMHQADPSSEAYSLNRFV